MALSGGRTAKIAAIGVVAAALVFVAFDRGVFPASADDSAWVAQMKSIERYVEAGGHRVRVIDTGGEGPALLLLHGWSDSTYTWRALIPRMRASFRVVALDWPGFGYSDKPDGAVPFPALAKVAAGVLERLGIDAAFVAGNSMGGGAAIQLAADYPARVRGLVLIDAHSAATDGVRNTMLASLLVPVIGELGAYSMGRAVYRPVVRGLIFDRGLVDAETVREMYLPLNTPGGRRSMLAQFREITAHPPPWELVAKVRAPTIIIWGRDDHLIPQSAAGELNRHIAGSQVALLDKTGHLPQWERPDEVARLIRGLIDGR